MNNLKPLKLQRRYLWQRHADLVRSRYPLAHLKGFFKGNNLLGWRIVCDGKHLSKLHQDDEAAWLDAAENFA